MKQHNTRMLRMFLCFLLLANMALIFAFSAQSGEQSGATSSRLTQMLLTAVRPDWQELSAPEQARILDATETVVRKAAHMIEFGSLGLLFLLLLATWEDGYLFLKYLLSLAFVLFYAATDELHQTMVAARAGQLQDVLIDLGGALLLCTAALPYLLKKQTRDGGTPSRKDL